MRYDCRIYHSTGDHTYYYTNVDPLASDYLTPQTFQYLKVTPDLTDVTFEKKFDEKHHYRTSATGEIKFKQTDYDYIRGSEKEFIYMDIYQNSVLILKLKFSPRAGIDFDYKQIKLAEYQSLDEYSLIEQEKEIERDFIAGIAKEYSLQCANNVIEYDDYTWYGTPTATIDLDPVTGQPTTFILTTGSPGGNYESYWRPYRIEYFKNGGGLYDHCTVRYARLIYYGTEPEVKPYVPEQTGLYYLAPFAVDGIGLLSKWGRRYPVEPLCYDRVADVFTNTTAHHLYWFWTTRARRFTDLIEFMITESDNSVNFDSTGTATDSFYFWKTNGSLLSYSRDAAMTAHVNPFKDLMFVGLSDFLPGEDGYEKTTGQTLSKLKWSEIEKWLNNYGFYYEIEDRSGSRVFVLKHKSQDYFYNLASPYVDDFPLLNYRNRNWMYKTDKFDFLKGSYNRIQPNIQSSSPQHWEGKKTYIYNFPNIEESSVYTIESQYVFTDIIDIFARGEGAYDAGGIDKIVLVSAADIYPGSPEPFASQFVARCDNGEMGAFGTDEYYWQTVCNQNLGFQFLEDYSRYDLQDNSWYTDAGTKDNPTVSQKYTLDMYRISLNRKYTMKVPAQTFGQDFEFEKIFRFGGIPGASSSEPLFRWGRIMSIKQQAFSNLYEIEYHALEEIRTA